MALPISIYGCKNRVYSFPKEAVNPIFTVNVMFRLKNCLSWFSIAGCQKYFFDTQCPAFLPGFFHAEKGKSLTFASNRPIIRNISIACCAAFRGLSAAFFQSKEE